MIIKRKETEGESAPCRNTMKVESTFVGNDGKERKVLKVIKDGSVVAVAYSGFAKDFREVAK